MRILIHQQITTKTDNSPQIDNIYLHLCTNLNFIDEQTIIVLD